MSSNQARTGDRAREGLGAPAKVAVEASGRLIGGALAAVARLRGGKAVHPHGATHRALLRIAGGPEAPSESTLLSTPREWPAIVRFSRSLGVPRPIPDLLGMSLRVLDAYGHGRHQDLLMVSSIDRPVLHHIFVPSADVQQRPYSSSLPYRAGDRSFIVGARPVSGSPRPDGDDELHRLALAAATGRLRFELVIAEPRGRFVPLGSLEIGERLPEAADALRFNPFNCGGGLEPHGFLNRLRDYAYPLSQRAWARSGGRDEAQQRADELVGDLSEPEAGAPGSTAARRNCR